MRHSRQRIDLPAEQIQTIARAIAEGATIAEQAEAVGLARGTLRAVLARAGLGGLCALAYARSKDGGRDRLAAANDWRRVEMPEPLHEVAGRVAGGESSVKSEADRLGVGSATLRRRLCAAGLPTRATVGGGR